MFFPCEELALYDEEMGGFKYDLSGLLLLGATDLLNESY